MVGCIFILFFFSLFCSASVISTVQSSSSLIHSSSVTALLVPSSIFLISVLHCSWLTVYSLILLCPFKTFLPFSSSMRSVYLSMPPFCFEGFGSSLLWLFGIIFHADSLFPPHVLGLVGLHLVPSPAAYFSVFILFNLLCLGSPFCRLEGCSS